MSSKRVRTVAADLAVTTGKLSSGMRRAEQIVAKSTGRMQRDMSRVESGVSRQGGGAVARGSRQSRLTGMVGSAKSMLKGAAVMGGVYGIGSEIKKAKQFEEVLVDVAVRGSKNKQWMDSLRGSMVAISNEYGVAKEQLADYVGTIIDQTGNTELATSTLKSMAAVAFSANVPMKELAGTVVEMQSKLALAPKEFETALGILAAQADKGKVPLNQMSKFLPEVLNATVQFGHTGVGALRDYGAVLQMAARGAGSLAEANTAMNRMLDQVAAKRGKIEKTLGIKLKKNGAWLQLGDMLKEIVAGLIKMKASGKDVEKYITTTFGIRGKKAILPLLQQGMMGWGNKVGSKGGKGGLTSFNDLVAAGGAGTIQNRVARKRQLSPELNAWNKSVEQLKNKLHMHLLPAIKKLGEIIPTVSQYLGWMIDNWKMLLVVWGSAKMLKFFASLSSLATGGGAIGGVGKLLGMGGAAAGAGGGGTAAATTAGGATLVGGLGAATAALGLFAVSLAPAIAGLNELGNAYDKKKQKEFREGLMGTARAELARRRAEQDKRLRAQGWKGVDEGPQTHRQAWQQRVRKQYGTSAGELENLRADYALLKKGKFDTGATGAAQFGRGRIERLMGASDADLGAVGLNKDMLATLINAADAMTKSSFEAKEKETAEALKTLPERILASLNNMTVKAELIDPNKTAAGVTGGRRGSQ